jgi:SAM-dependent methyltransferase
LSRPRIPWEQEAKNWLIWARTPDHDVFSVFFPGFLQDIVPEQPGATLEIGCGEGRVLRHLSPRSGRLAGIDSSRTLLQAARTAHPGLSYALADAAALPFREGTFDTVISYNVLQALSGRDDMARSVVEAARVLKRGGHLCICTSHPMTDAGRLSCSGADLVLQGSYFERRLVEDRVERNGLQITFHGWTLTLQDYSDALEHAGLMIELLREPLPSDDSIEQRPELARWRRAPMFLFLRAVKP